MGYDRVSAGLDHNCAVKTDGSLWCWGGNFYSQLGDGTQEPRATPTRIGSRRWRTVVASSWFTCGIQDDDSLWCWGANSFGQLGDGTASPRSIPTPISPGTTWADVSVSERFACGLQANGSIWCWGRNESGQLGTGDLENRWSPTRVGADSDWRSISTGYDRTCALALDGTAWCWGYSRYRDLGVEDGPQVNPFHVATSRLWRAFTLAGPFGLLIAEDGSFWGASPGFAAQQLDGDRWVAVTAGDRHYCGLKEDGSAWCRGENELGQLGSESGRFLRHFAQVPSERGWRSLSAGGEHTCGVKTDHTLWCWGEDVARRGTGARYNTVTPAQLAPGVSWSSVSLGSTHSCAIRADGSLWCWGNNSYCQVGDETGLNRAEPVQIGAGSMWRSISGGYRHTCGVKTDGTLWCWGGFDCEEWDGVRHPMTQVGTDSDWRVVVAQVDKTCGQKEDGTIWCWDAAIKDKPATTPALVGTDSDWMTFNGNGGAWHVCGLKPDKSLWCWGLNQQGVFGNKLPRVTQVPIEAVPGTRWISASAGWDTTFGVREDGTLWGWGDTVYADDTGAEYTPGPPTQFGAANDWRSITAGNEKYCAMKTDRSVWCWRRYSQYEPRLEDAGTDWDTLAVSSDLVCGLKLDGGLWCWGRNDWGQLGLGGWSSTPTCVTESRVQN